jgi:hypothetical protein
MLMLDMSAAAAERLGLMDALSIWHKSRSGSSGEFCNSSKRLLISALVTLHLDSFSADVLSKR